VIFAERVGKFANRLWFAIVEMPRRAEDLDGLDARLRNLGQQRSSQRLVNIAIGGKDAMHAAPVRSN
jgi:hypothetical protein